MRITREMQRRIDEHRTVARRQDESVAVGPGRIGRVEFQIIRIKHRRDVGHAHRHPRMAAVHGLDGIHRKRADGFGELAFGQCHSSPGNGWAIMRDCALWGSGPEPTARGKQTRKTPGSPVTGRAECPESKGEYESM